MKLRGFKFDFNGDQYLVTTRVHKLIKDVVGISSQVIGTNDHVLFLDFDEMKLKDVVGILKKIQRKYWLSEFYILESSKNHYHAICLDAMTFGDVCQVQYELGMSKYIAFSARRGYWVLRISVKGQKGEPKLVGSICRLSYPPIRFYSLGHALWLNKKFGLNFNFKRKSDFIGKRKIKLDKYTTE